MRPPRVRRATLLWLSCIALCAAALTWLVSTDVAEPLPAPARPLPAPESTSSSPTPRQPDLLPPPRPIAQPAAPAAVVVAPPKAAPDPWAPPSPRERVFDLNADGAVEPDETERASEILALSQDFAARRSSDGSFPILEEDFRGDPRLFHAMDVDADGALSVREWVSWHVESIRQVRRFDQNHDGAITLAELGALASRFDYLDGDHDGELWAWEIDQLRGRGKW